MGDTTKKQSTVDDKLARCCRAHNANQLKSYATVNFLSAAAYRLSCVAKHAAFPRRSAQGIMFIELLNPANLPACQRNFGAAPSCDHIPCHMMTLPREFFYWGMCCCVRCRVLSTPPAPACQLPEGVVCQDGCGLCVCLQTTQHACL